MRPPRFFCRDIDSVVHTVSYDPYTDELKVECGRKFLWHGEIHTARIYGPHHVVFLDDGPATCMTCIAESES